MATHNFDDVLDLLVGGEVLWPSPGDYGRVVRRGLEKRAPFHRSKNGAADALLLEMYGAAASAPAGIPADQYCFVTQNVRDFSVADGDRRHPQKAILGLARRAAPRTRRRATTNVAGPRFDR